MKNKDVDIIKVMELIKLEATKKAEDAGYQGSLNDGGASILRNQVNFYTAGMNGTIPEEWKKYVKESLKISDPEYSEYIRLKEKYG